MISTRVYRYDDRCHGGSRRKIVTTMRQMRRSQACIRRMTFRIHGKHLETSHGKTQ